jgi:hypothetical protein
MKPLIGVRDKMSFILKFGFVGILYKGSLNAPTFNFHSSKVKRLIKDQPIALNLFGFVLSGT